MRIKDYIIFFMKTFGVLESLCIFAPLLTKSASDLNLNEQQMRFVRKELRKKFWRGGRVVDCGGLENRCTARYPGFESLSLRNKGCKSSICKIYTLFHTQKCNSDEIGIR